jgi:hypothetical protein
VYGLYILISMSMNKYVLKVSLFLYSYFRSLIFSFSFLCSVFSFYKFFLFIMTVKLRYNKAAL